MDTMELKYLQRLAELFPTIAKASTEIINLFQCLEEGFLCDLFGRQRIAGNGQNIFVNDQEIILIQLFYIHVITPFVYMTAQICFRYRRTSAFSHLI